MIHCALTAFFPGIYIVEYVLTSGFKMLLISCKQVVLWRLAHVIAYFAFVVLVLDSVVSGIYCLCQPAFTWSFWSCRFVLG